MVNYEKYNSIFKGKAKNIKKEENIGDVIPCIFFKCSKLC